MQVYLSSDTEKKRWHKEAQHEQMQELEAAETLQAAVMQQKSFSFPLTEEDKKEKKKDKVSRKSDSTAQANGATHLPRESSD